MNLLRRLSMVMICTFVLLAAMGTVNASSAKDRLVLAIPNNVPFEGTNASDAVEKKYFGAMLRRDLEKSIFAEYEIEYIYSNYARVHKSMQSNDNVCLMGVYKTPKHEELYHITKTPNLYTLSPVLVMSSLAWQRLDKPESISLENVLKNYDYKLSVSRDRSLGSVLQPIADTYSRNVRVHTSNNDVSTHLIFLTGIGRADMTIAYPEEVIVSKQLHGDDFDTGKIATVFIEETATISSFYYACSKSDLGREVVNKLDQELLRMGFDHLSRYYLHWIPDRLHNLFLTEAKSHWNKQTKQ